MELVHFSGSITAYCSGLIIEPHDEERTIFLSACGYQATVKAIMARVLEGMGVSIKVGEQAHYIERAQRGYRYETNRLPSGLAHSIIFPLEALSGTVNAETKEFFVFSERRQDVLDRFFRHLDARTELPLHPSWSGWLFERFKQIGWAEELHTILGPFKGFQCWFNTEELQELISKAIQSKEPEIVECLRRKEVRP